MLGSKDLGLNIYNYILYVLANREPNTSSLCVRHCSKVYVSSFKFELTAKKNCQNYLAGSIDRKLGSTNRKLQKLVSAEFLNKAQARENV